MALSDSDRAALHSLTMLRERGWVFVPHVTDGQVVLLTGVRMWPGGWADAVGILGAGDAQAARTDPDGGLVWRRAGTVVEVADGLLDLPPPHSPDAPRLVIGTWRRP